MKCTIRAWFVNHGIAIKGGEKAWNTGQVLINSFRKPIAECSPNDLWKAELDIELTQLAALKVHLDLVTKQLEAIGKNDPRIKRLMTIPGVGPRTAEIIVACIDDPNRFQNGRQVSAYFGLIPRQINLERPPRRFATQFLLVDVGAYSLLTGFVWLDQAESWDTIVDNGNVTGKFDFLTVVTREIGHAMGLQDTSVSPTGIQLMQPNSSGEVISFQMHCGCGGTPTNAMKYGVEENQISDSVSSTLKHLYGGAVSIPDNNSGGQTSQGGFYTGQGSGYRWQDQIPSTPDTIDIYYDFRSQNGYSNSISPEQISLTEQAMKLWGRGSHSRIHFVRSDTAPLTNIINIGVDDLAALGSTSSKRGTLALGGGTFTTVAGQRTISDGIAWLDIAESWDSQIGNGDITDTFDFFTVIAHELGHAIGLGHTDFFPGPDIMDGRYAGEKSALSGNDEMLINLLYSGVDQPPVNDGGASDGNFLATGSGGFHIVSVGAGSITGNLDFGSRFSLPNPRQSLDTNDDQSVDPLDVLTVINWINSHEASTAIDPSIAATNYYDVDGDNSITPLDVLAIINFINSRLRPLGEGEADGQSQLQSLNPAGHFPFENLNAFQLARPIEQNFANSDRSVNLLMPMASLGLVDVNRHVVLDTTFAQSNEEEWKWCEYNKSERESSDEVTLDSLLELLALKRLFGDN